MSTLREAAQQALEALKYQNILNISGHYSVVDPVKASKAMDALRAALAEPERKSLTRQKLIDIELGLRRYTSGYKYDLSLHDFARAIEAAHGIKQEEA